MDEHYHEVYFYQYCKDCKYEKTPQEKDPCHECLSETMNLYSHKPVKYEDKDQLAKNTSCLMEGETKNDIFQRNIYA